MQKESEANRKLFLEKKDLEQKLYLKQNEISSLSFNVAQTEALYQRAESWRCSATTRAGNRCKRNAQDGRSFCWQH